jgi:hypothetical protein
VRQIPLVYLASPRTGGWVQFTAHLYRGLLAAGCQPLLYRVGARTERKTRPFGFGLEYLNVALPALSALCQADGAIITAAEPARAQDVACLRGFGAGMVVHDPTELKGGMAAAIGNGTGPLWAIRPAMLAHVPGAQLIPHPYAPAEPPWPSIGAKHAVAFSRLDWDKHTDTIVAANALLPAPMRVSIYGTENRLYTHHKLPEGWRASYCGAMERRDLWAGQRLAASAQWAVDLSAIAGEGGGTQYTFLEALDGGARLVISADWLTGDPAADTIAPYATVVNGAAELAAVLGGPADYAEDRPTGLPAELLWRHDPGTVARTMLEAMK